MKNIAVCDLFTFLKLHITGNCLIELNMKFHCVNVATAGALWPTSTE